MDYILKKGKHRATPRKLKIYAFTKNFEWNVKFSKECWYDRNDVEFTGVNKLRGLTFGIHNETPWGKWKLTKWLVNSALIGWQPDFNDTDKQNINLYLYYDINGVEHRNIFNVIKTEEVLNIKFSIRKDGVYVKIDNNEEYCIPTNTFLKFGYHLFPYFGGKSASPNDMLISMNYTLAKD